MLGPVRLRQDHRAADDRRLRAPDRRAGAARRATTSPAAPPFARDVNTVFQDYALFPHMGVLRERRVRAAGQEGRRSASAAAGRGGAGDGAARGLRATAARTSSPAGSGSASRWPGRWSTGRRCCCSTSRSAPSTSSCAREMQIELKQIQREVGITFVFVTHDQEEALSMSDRVAVFNDGRVEQVATPVELYERPATPVRRRLRRHLEPARGRGGRSGRRHAGGVRRPAREDLARRSRRRAGATRRRVASPGGVREVVYLGADHPRHRRARRRAPRLTVSRPNTGTLARPRARGPTAAIAVALHRRRDHIVALGTTRRHNRGDSHDHRGDLMKSTTDPAAVARLRCSPPGWPAAAPRAAAAPAAAGPGPGLHPARRPDAAVDGRDGGHRSTSWPGRATPRTAPTTRRSTG